jgi:hypothetical protein
MDLDELEPDSLLTAGEVAGIFKVNPKTVTRWRWPEGTSIRTPGNHLRFRVWFVKKLLNGEVDLDRTESDTQS